MGYENESHQDIPNLRRSRDDADSNGWLSDCCARFIARATATNDRSGRRRANHARGRSKTASFPNQDGDLHACHFAGDNVPSVRGQSVPSVRGQSVPPVRA